MNKENIVTWSDAYKYASELVDDGIFSKHEINKELNNNQNISPEVAYNWLARVATERHVSMLNNMPEEHQNIETIDIDPNMKKKKINLIKALGSGVSIFATIATLTYIKDNEDLDLKDAPIIWLGANMLFIGLAIISSER